MSDQDPITPPTTDEPDDSNIYILPVVMIVMTPEDYAAMNSEAPLTSDDHAN